VADEVETPFNVDLTNCDREPIHLLGAVQPFGFLVAVDADWRVTRASTNIEAFLGVAHRDLIGAPLASVIAVEALHSLRNRMAVLQGVDVVERLFHVDLVEGRPALDLAVHQSGAETVIEGEAAAPKEFEASGLVRAFVSRLQRHDDVMAFLREGARQVRALTGFDRVKVYRFDSTGSGEVVAEALRAGVDSFLGLHYPASDIPAQARILYLRNTFRVIADIGAEGVPIEPARVDGKILDLSLSVLRSVSPIHIEYLKNMGVGASLSISIVVDGKLWGLFACHHYAPRLPNFAERTAAELFGQMFSMMLESRERRRETEFLERAHAIAEGLMAGVAQDADRLRDPSWIGDTVSELIPNEGVGVSIDGRIVLNGLTPPRERFRQLIGRLSATGRSGVIATDRIADLMPSATGFESRAAGMIAIPLSRTPRDYIVLFRPEQLRSVRWGGNPEKEVEYGPNGPRLTPRKSFEEWSELVRGRAAPFTDAERNAAESLRTALLEVALQLTERAGEERRKAAEQQELLIGELNHRVRNILALIRGLISQSRANAADPKEFVEILEDRIQALARAHDQITRDQWEPAPLLELIRTEASAYLGVKRDRVRMTGPQVLVAPAAFTTLALVIHELMTNAAKYGALSDSGRVDVSWQVDDEGDLKIFWSEVGGPAVQAPKRRGFGSSIIERTIPHDLGGRAEIRFRLSGLEAEFCVPARYVTVTAAEPTTVAIPVDGAGPDADRPLDGLSVLLVEDSMIIGLDGEDALRRLGARNVEVAASVESALTAIDHGVEFAVLDFNLGAVTSLPVADRLLKLGVPFLFATGYGDRLDLPARHADAPVVNKPYVATSLLSAIRAARGA
jgi:light-regulated signal transduction histidine kinase (bacteriophytochrome)